jgi:hypothetical protein
MATKPMMMKPAGKTAAKKTAAFTPCKVCPNPAKCKALGKCMMAKTKK